MENTQDETREEHEAATDGANPKQDVDDEVRRYIHSQAIVFKAAQIACSTNLERCPGGIACSFSSTSKLMENAQSRLVLPVGLRPEPLRAPP